jgi:hypothetical protein
MVLSDARSSAAICLETWPGPELISGQTVDWKESIAGVGRRGQLRVERFDGLESILLEIRLRDFTWRRGLVARLKILTWLLEYAAI